MSDDKELLFYEDEEELTFSEGAVQDTKEGKLKWKVMIVDDDHEVHKITKLVLSSFQFKGKTLEFISAYNGEEARRLLSQNTDIAVILLDVVMEEDDTGLKLVRFIREELGNRLMRIILRTGQPGQAPEEQVIIEYDINSYKEKTELTSQKLFTELVASLRSYKDLMIIGNTSKGLQKVILDSTSIMNNGDKGKFAKSIFTSLLEIIELSQFGEKLNISGFAAYKREDCYEVLACAGIYQELLNNQSFELPAKAIANFESLKVKENIYFDNGIAALFSDDLGKGIYFYFDGFSWESIVNRELIEVYCTNLSILGDSISNAGKYEAEKKQRLLSESLRELNQRLTSTLEEKRIYEILLDGLSQVVDYDMAWAASKMNSSFEVTALKDFGKRKAAEVYLAKGNIIESDVLNLGLPFTISDIGQCASLLNRELLSEAARSMLLLPLCYKGKQLGVVVLQSEQYSKYSEHDRNMAIAFTNQAVIALENAKLFHKLKSRNAAVRNLLDNTGQGFLSFTGDLIIEEEYSQECLSIFGREIAGEHFIEVINLAVEDRGFWENTLKAIFEESDEFKREIVLSLLIRECRINERYIALDYKLINNNGHKKIMVILTDITDKKQLESQIETERKTLKMIVNVLVNYNDFIYSVNDFTAFYSTSLPELLKEQKPVQEIVYELYRNIHTFKGVFSQLGIIHISGLLHEFENQLIELQQAIQDMTLDRLRGFIQGVCFEHWLDQDKNIIREVLGEQILHAERVVMINQTSLETIESKVKEILGPQECGILLPMIKRLRNKSFKDMVSPYASNIISLASRLDKMVNPIYFEGGDFVVDSEVYGAFCKALVHVFRNAVDHGIEPPDVRVQCYKPECGNIYCKIDLCDDIITLCIEDDGMGLDGEIIKNSAVMKGLYTYEQLLGMKEEEVNDIIFMDEFTLKESATEYSGRGFGLPAVKQEVQRLGGDIKVESKIGSGTRFIFTLPYKE